VTHGEAAEGPRPPECDAAGPHGHLHQMPRGVAPIGRPHAEPLALGIIVEAPRDHVFEALAIPLLLVAEATSLLRALGVALQADLPQACGVHEDHLRVALAGSGIDGPVTRQTLPLGLEDV